MAAASREKITRVALSTLRNLATFHTSSAEDGFDSLAYRTEMVGCRLLTRLERLKEAAKWNDQDMVDDIDILEGHLQATFRHMTRWDLYQAEVESSHLQWGLLHTDNFFEKMPNVSKGMTGSSSESSTIWFD
jgi:hypothetical protein